MLFLRIQEENECEVITASKDQVCCLVKLGMKGFAKQYKMGIAAKDQLTIVLGTCDKDNSKDVPPCAYYL